MEKKELELILQEGEGLANLDKEIVAFANTDGGRLFVGVTDNEKAKSIKITNKLKCSLQVIDKFESS